MELLEEIGRGSSARVYKALWEGTFVAVKAWDPSIVCRKRQEGDKEDSAAASASDEAALLQIRWGDAASSHAGSVEKQSSTERGGLTQLAQFRAEVQVLSALRHPNILTFFGIAPPLSLARIHPPPAHPRAGPLCCRRLPGRAALSPSSPCPRTL